MAPLSFACAKDAFLRSVLLRFASVRLAPVNLARVSRARCSTAPERSAPDRSASTKSLRLSGARASAQPGQDLVLPATKAASPAVQDRWAPAPAANARAHSNAADKRRERCDIMRS